MGIFGFGSARPNDVVSSGSSDRATVIGITVTGSGGGPHTVDYALEVGAPDPFLAAARMTGGPPMTVRLGTTLQVFHLESQVVIDWLGSGADEVTDTQPLRAVPAAGIHDHTLGLEVIQRRGVPATGTITSAEVGPSSRGDGARLYLTMFVERHGLTGYETELNLPCVPHYADHLCTVDRILPVWVTPERPDDVVIDWPEAATADPGADDPPAAVLADLPPVADPSARRARTGRRRDSRGLVAAGDGDDVIIDLTREPDDD